MHFVRLLGLLAGKDWLGRTLCRQWEPSQGSVNHRGSRDTGASAGDSEFGSQIADDRRIAGHRSGSGQCQPSELFMMAGECNELRMRSA